MTEPRPSSAAGGQGSATSAWPPAGWAGGRAVLLAGGEAEPADFVQSVVAAGDLVIAANGGARLAATAGLVPHLLVGDQDSLAADVAASLPPSTLRWLHPAAKDESDLELALQAALSARATDIVVLGAYGGRLDHLLVNLGLLHQACDAGVPMRLASVRAEAFVVDGRSADASVTRALQPGQIVTVVALTPEVTGVCMRGFRYPLEGETMRWGSSRGLSNVVETDAQIRVARGRLLVVIPHTPTSTRLSVRRTYLEMRSPMAATAGPEGGGAGAEGEGVTVTALEGCTVSYYRYLYAEVGRAWRWLDRLAWTDDEVLANLQNPEVRVWVMAVHGVPAGWFELRRVEATGSTEIAYFGLFAEFMGRGFGRRLLERAIHEAWAGGTSRVWLHTCTLDGPAALPNYCARGFVVFREEMYEGEILGGG